jgi:hypothetical protein
LTTPDFERIARLILDRYVGGGETSAPLGGAIADALRLAWNARGAADIAKIESELAQQMGATASGPYTKNLDRALRRLDA